jgi:hypothetical protein
MFTAQIIDSFVSGSFRPCFDTLTVLLIVLPLSFISSFIHICIDTVAICLVSRPISVVDITINMVKSSFTAGYVEGPLTFVHGTIRPGHFTSTVTETSLPLALVDSISFVGVALVYDRGILIVPTLQGLVCFLFLEIFGRLDLT